jgi:plastocyanin
LARAGVFTLAAVLASSACDRVGQPGDEGPRVLELTHDTIRLESGVRLIDVQVRRESSGEFQPPRVEAHVGDVVRFTAGDLAGHAISFVGAELDPAVLGFLEATGQLRSPPLITTDASWVITLEGAPAGEYPFHCSVHNARGHLTVSPR